SRPADGLADAEAVYERNEVERVALLVDAEIAPDAGLRTGQMDTEAIPRFTRDRPAAPFVAFAMTGREEVANELVNPTGEHMGDVGRLHAALALATCAFSTRRRSVSICLSVSGYRASRIDSR